MRVTRSCVAAATALLSTARHAEAAERTAGGTGLVAAGGNDQQPLMPAGPEDNEHGDDLLRGLLDIMQLDLGQTEPDAESRDFKSCAACETLLAGLKVAAAGGDNLFINTATRMCKRLKVQDDDVCEGSIAREGPIAARALRGMTPGSRTSRLFCVASMGYCSYPEVDVDELSFPSPKPPSRVPGGGRSRPPPSGRKPLRVVHYSDIHVDPWYVSGANANCSKPICCRNYSATDLPSKHDVPAGPNGDHKCDVPASLEESMYAAIRELVPDAAFSIFTGDIVDHAIWNTTVAQNTLDIDAAYRRMSDAGLLVYGTAGNHESSPTNSYPPTNGTLDHSEGLGVQWLYDLLSSSWSRWIEPGAVKETKDFGAYSAKYVSDSGSGSGTLRIISLNTNLFYRHNTWLYEEPMRRDPSGQFAWLVGELEAAERAGDRVYIIGHMPPGSADAFHEASNYLDQIVNRYEGTIAAMFFGHTHRDEFQLSYSDYEKRNFTNAVAMSYIAPSLTPTSGHPSFRVYDVDPVTFGVLDVTTYAADMSDPEFQTQGPKWRKYYSAKETYGPLVSDGSREERDADGNWELTPAFWHNVTEALERDADAFEDYIARKSRGWTGAGGGCYGRGSYDGDEEREEREKECARIEICRLRGARSQDNCQVPRSKTGFGRTEVAGVPVGEDWRQLLQQEEEECESSVMRDTFSALGLVVEALAVAR